MSQPELDKLVLARIEEEMKKGHFSSERLREMDYRLLLEIFLSVHPSLPLFNLDQCEDYLSHHPILYPALGEVYVSKSFSKLMEHSSISALKISTQDEVMGSFPLVKSSSNRSLQAAFETEYQGGVHHQFISVLNEYALLAGLYNKSIAIIQSSGMGKSRLVQESASEVFTIPANLREGLPQHIKAYPPPDATLRSYFENHEFKSDKLLQAEYAILLKCIFDEAISTVPAVVGDRKGRELARAWSSYLDDGQSDESVGENRLNFYKKVIQAAEGVGLLKRHVISLIIEMSAQAISKISDRVWVDTKLHRLVSPATENPLQQASKTSGQIQIHYELKESVDLKTLFAGMGSSAKQLLQTVALEGSSHENLCLVYFDEAHDLTKAPRFIEGFRYRSPYHNLGTILSELCDARMFFIFLSTNSQMHQFAPPPRHYPSTRAAQGSYLISPFTELPFDVFMTEMFKELEQSKKKRSLVNACTTQVMSSMGRPMWFAHHKQWQDRQGVGPPNSGQQFEHVLKFAANKLTAQESPKHVSQSELAALSVRIGITFESTTQAAREAESQQVESHMRVVYAIPEHREYMRTGTPSEPVLAEAAAVYLSPIFNNSGISIAGPRILSENCKKGFLARGERGELCGRLLVSIAHDIAVVETRVEIEKSLVDGRVRYHRPVPVLAFLRALFADEHHDTILEATPMTYKEGKPLKDAFKEAFVCFSHFALAADSAMLDAKSLRTALFRGAAIQAKDNQVSIDAVIPIHIGPITSPITTETTSAINLQFKNRKRTDACFVNRSITVPDPHQPVISIVFELGEELSDLRRGEPKQLVEAHEWDLPYTRSRDAELNPHKDDRHYSFVARGCGPGTYKAVHEETIGYYKMILASGSLKEDFPRAGNKASWALIEELKPHLIASKCWNQWDKPSYLDSEEFSGPSTPLDTKSNLESIPSGKGQGSATKGKRSKLDRNVGPNRSGTPGKKHKSVTKGT
ncbi:unnamed protein product [Rhizoctonia solani]|uniref:Uncharacterized protein n=1 Tax=Rhizoctonia solani TaxID=456999 RepID=A0A8H3AWH3_9AGAM|nr:unnamed protein product [Rhizoctonia solani]